MKEKIIISLLIGLILLNGCGVEQNYNYIGKIIDIEGGSSKQVLVLTLDTIGKVPYTTQWTCSNKIRLGQSVYERTDSDYLWVEYDIGKFC